MKLVNRGVAIVAPFFLYIKNVKWSQTYSTIVYVGIILYATFALFFGLYTIDQRLQENQKRLDDLKISVENYQLSIEQLNIEIESYKSKIPELKTTTATKESISQQDKPNPNLMILAQLIESEAGNQSFQGKLAVGTVVMNRVDSKQFPNTIKDVIFQKGQFSPVANGKIYNKPSADSLKAAKDILDGVRVLEPDVLYFYNPKFVKTTNWIRGRKVSKQIDDHLFAM